MTNFFTELRRRNVISVAAAYALVAWIIIEAGSVLLPTFGAPEWAFKVYVIAVFAGFILALILSWVFEITSDGIKRDADARVSEHTASKRAYGAIIVLLVTALTVSITFNLTDIRNQSVLSSTEPLQQWIAILPLDNLSTNPDNAVFADGIHDDLLTKLANNQALRVISRTSVLKYRDTDKNIRQIGEELKVDTILEGSVQRVGDSVRINVQLVDARTDEHLWAKSYDRKLTMEDIFDIQSEISTAISAELRATLNPDEELREARVPTKNMAAYNLYVKARNNMALREQDNAIAARKQFEQALELDPDFAEAHAGLATSILLLQINHQLVEREEALRLTAHELDVALKLNPDLADAYATLGLLKLNMWQGSRAGKENLEADAAFTRALEINPNHASAYMWFGSLREAEGKIQEAIELFKKSQALDPLGRIPYANLPNLYAALGQNEEALKQWINATKIHPDWSTLDEYIAVHLHKLGRLDEALAWMAHARVLSGGAVQGTNLDAGIYVEFGEIDRAKAIMQQTPDDHPMADLRNAMTMLISDDAPGALQYLVGVVNEQPKQSPYIYHALANVALLNGDLDTAQKYLLKHMPLMADSSKLVLDKMSSRAAVEFAYIALQQGDKRQARELFNKTLKWIKDRPRLGSTGYGILDVQIYAALGEHEKAIAAFREAVEAGFRSSVSFDFWTLERDPYLNSIRDDERFKALKAVIDTDLHRMKENAVVAEQNDDWKTLRQLAINKVSGTTPI